MTRQLDEYQPEAQAQALDVEIPLMAARHEAMDEQHRRAIGVARLYHIDWSVSHRDVAQSLEGKNRLDDFTRRTGGFGVVDVGERERFDQLIEGEVAVGVQLRQPRDELARY